MKPGQWIVVVTSCAIAFINVGLLISMGALFHPISENFKTNRPATALVQSLTFGTMVIGVIVGFLVDKYGLWKVSLIGTVFTVVGFGGGFFATTIFHLYIVSTVSGVGMATLGMGTIVAVEKATEGRAQSTALAIHNSCIGLGALVYPHFLTYLVATYGLNGTYLIIAGVYCNAIVFVIVTLNLCSQTAVTKTIVLDTCILNTYCKSSTECNVLTNCKTSHRERFIYNMKTNVLRIFSIPYVLTWVASVGTFSAADGYVTTCVDMYTSMGFTEQQGITSMVFYQTGNIAAGLFSAGVKQFENVNVFSIPIVLSVCGSIGIILTYFASFVQVAFAGACFLGLSEGVLTGVLLILAEIVPTELYGTAFGIILTSLAMTSFAAGPINGAIRDATGSYAAACLAILIALVLPALLFALAGFIQRKARVLEAQQPKIPVSSTSVAAGSDNHSFASEARPEFASRSTYM